MNSGKTLFAQLMAHLPWTTYSRIVSKYRGNHRVRVFPCTEHYRVMAFAQLTYRESLRDIEASLSAQSHNLYHMGFRETVRRSTLADANEHRDWRIYAEFAQRLIIQARKLYSRESLGLDLGEKWSIVVYLSRFDQAAIFSMLSCTPSLNTTPSMT